MAVASVPVAIGQGASALADIGQPVFIVAVPLAIVAGPLAIVAGPLVIVAGPLPTEVAPTVVVRMATVPGVRQQQGLRSGLRRLARRPRTITATNAATIPIHRATSLTRKAPITSTA